MKKLLIHIGVPKTATTTLQESIFYPLSQNGMINYFGRIQFEKDPIHIEQYAKTYKLISGTRLYRGETIPNIPLNVELKEDALRREKSLFLTNNFKEYRDLVREGIYNVYSEENVTSPYIFIHSLAEMPEVLRKIFVDNDTVCKILITIRNQKDAIPSGFAERYHDYIRYNEYNTPQKQFFNSNNTLIKDERFLGHDYSYLVEAYKKVFGNENVVVAIFEELKENKFYYHELVADLLGIDLEVVKEVSTEKRYRDKVKTKTGEYITHIPVPGLKQKIMKAIIYSQYSKGIKSFLNKFPIVSYRLKQMAKPNKSIKQVVPSFTQEQIDIIYKEYLDSNNRLHEVHGLDKEKLQKYGYI